MQLFFNSNKDQDTNAVLNKHLEKVQAGMKENIQKMMEREAKVEMLVKKTQKTYTISEEIQSKVCRGLGRQMVGDVGR